MSTFDLLVALAAKSDAEVRQELGPCQAALVVLGVVHQLRELLASPDSED